MAKIAIGMATNGTVRDQTVTSLIGILSNTPHECYVILRNGTLVQENRRAIVMDAIAQKCGYLLFMDSDMVLWPDTLNRLLALDKDIVGINYHMRVMPITSTVKVHDIYGNIGSIKFTDMPEEPFLCAGVGTGCMLIKMSVIKELSPPLFDFIYKPDGSIHYGEDTYFCKKAIDSGFQVWCDPTIPAGHVGQYVY